MICGGFCILVWHHTTLEGKGPAWGHVFFVVSGNRAEPQRTFPLASTAVWKRSAQKNEIWP